MAEQRPQAVATLMIDNERARVTRFDFDPGAETGWHQHQMDYVITAITDCEMLLEEPGGGSRTTFVAAGTSYARPEGIAHNVINAGKRAMSFVEVELK